MCLSYQIDAQSQTGKWVNPLCVKNSSKRLIKCIVFRHFFDAPHIPLAMDSVETATVTISAKRYGREPVSLCLLVRLAWWRVIANHTGLAFNQLNVLALCARHGLFVFALQNNLLFLFPARRKKPSCTQSNYWLWPCSSSRLILELPQIHLRGRV